MQGCHACHEIAKYCVTSEHKGGRNSRDVCRSLPAFTYGTLPNVGKMPKVIVSSVGGTMCFPFCAVLSGPVPSLTNGRQSVCCPQTKETTRSAQVGKVGT